MRASSIGTILRTLRAGLLIAPAALATGCDKVAAVDDGEAAHDFHVRQAAEEVCLAADRICEIVSSLDDPEGDRARCERAEADCARARARDGRLR